MNDDSLWKSVWDDPRLNADRLGEKNEPNPIPKEVRYMITGALGAMDVLLDELFDGQYQMARRHIRALERICEELPGQIAALSDESRPDPFSRKAARPAGIKGRNL